MYIPGWLLVIGVIVALFAFQRLRAAAGAALVWAILIGVGLLLIALLVSGLYLAFKYGLVGFLIAGALSAYFQRRADSIRDRKGRLKVGTLKRRLKQHEKEVARAEGPADVVDARLAFARELKLGLTLLGFYQHIVTYQAWLAEASNGETPWASSVIPKNAIGSTTRDFFATTRGLPVDDERQDDEGLHYALEAAGQVYDLVAFEEQVPEPRFEVTAGWTPRAVRLFVLDHFSLDQPATVLLEVLLLYEETPKQFRYRQDVIAAFRPSEWLVELMSVADGVEQEYATRLESEKLDRATEQAKRFA